MRKVTALILIVTLLIASQQMIAEGRTVKASNLNQSKQQEYKSRHDRAIAKEARKQGVDELLAVAISRLETGNYKSEAFKKLNNYGGMMSSSGRLQKFKSKKTGRKAFIKLLKWYHEQGMTTPEKMAPVYCPGSEKWAKIVRQIMKEQKEN